MDKYLLIAFLIILFFIFPIKNLEAKEPLIIFHLDFNSVSLQEDYIKQWLKKASDMGYNAVLWEIEDDVKWETCPECVKSRCFF